VYDRDATTLRSTVSATGASWADPLGVVGQAVLSAPLVQTIMQTDPALLNNAIVKVATNVSGTSTLTEIFGFLAEGGDWTLITDKEQAGEERSLQCRGLLGIFDDWVVYPETGLKAHSGDQRAFGWMSAESTHWFDATQWDGTINATDWSAVSATADRYRRPKKWPDPSAAWVGCGAKEKQYFRTQVTVTEDTPVRVYASADEDLRVYLDSELIISNNSREVGYTELNRWRGVLTAGTHTFGIKFLKTFDVTYTNWSGSGVSFTDADKMIITVAALKPNGDIDSFLRHSGDGAVWYAAQRDDGDRPPTWTAAGIIQKLIHEARDRSVQSAQRLDMSSFDYQTDSDTVAWPDLHERQWPVGTKGSQVIADLAELDVDFDMTPDLVLRAFVDQGADVSATVKLVKGVNILSYKIHPQPILATSLLIRSHNRWVERTDTASELVNDRCEGFLQTGGSLSREHARHVGDRALDDLARERMTATAEVIATTDCVPYIDFYKGDTVMAYDKTMTATPMRVVSISGAVSEGPIRFTVELEEP
jgi:hypothetical protein